MKKKLVLTLAVLSVLFLSGCTTLREHVLMNDVAGVNEYIALSGNGEIDMRDEAGETPLTYAARNGHTALAKILIQHGANINQTNVHGSTPLVLVAQNGHTDMVKFLTEQGGDINQRNNYGATPLIWAARSGHTDIVKFLTEQGGDINQACIYGLTPLMYAAWKGHTDIVKFLTGQGGDINQTDNNGQTPLLLAALNGHADIVKFLTEQGGDINQASNFGTTPLMLAAWNGRTESVKFLLENGADINIKDQDGSTALSFAQTNNQTAIYNLLLNAQQQGRTAKVEQQLTHAKKIQPAPLQQDELKKLIAQKDMKGLRIFLDKHPEMLSSIEDNDLRLRYTGPSRLRIVDIAQLAKAKKKEVLIVAQINSVGGPYKDFNNDELNALNTMAIPDEVIAAMITVTTTYNKEQDRLGEEKSRQVATIQAQQVQQVQQVQQAEQAQPLAGAIKTSAECVALKAAIKLCDKTGGLFAMGCKIAAESQFYCPISVEALLR